MKLSDFKGLFNNTNIKLVEKKQDTSDIFIFTFELAKKTQWKPGQHGIFKFKGEKMQGKNFRVFSISSVSEENKIIIGTRITENPSEFKKKLKAMNIGDTMSMTGPIGWFYINNYGRPIALIAGGVGITPIRALLKDLEVNAQITKTVEVFYSDNKSEYAFQSDLKYFDEKYDFIKVNYINNRENLQDKLNSFRSKYGNEASYFISGAPKMVTSLKSQLKENGIKNNNILTDPYNGYL